MSLIKLIYRKLFLKIGEYLIPTKKIDIPFVLNNKKNIFIYFDYEREFGGHETNITDKDIFQIITLLNQYHNKTTWFTVGKIFHAYPETIKFILENGHEISSHTYSHTPLFKMKAKDIKKDFLLFAQSSEKIIKVKGFHSPQGQWNLKMFKYLISYNFSYDLSSGSNKNNGIPFYIYPWKKKKIVRLRSVGDDWPLFIGNYTEFEVFSYLVNLIEQIKTGTISGIGFHPWILYSNNNILNGFKLFLEYINNQKNIEIKPAIEFIEQIKTGSTKKIKR